MAAASAANDESAMKKLARSTCEWTGAAVAAAAHAHDGMSERKNE